MNNKETLPAIGFIHTAARGGHGACLEMVGALFPHSMTFVLPPDLDRLYGNLLRTEWGTKLYGWAYSRTWLPTVLGPLNSYNPTVRATAEVLVSAPQIPLIFASHPVAMNAAIEAQQRLGITTPVVGILPELEAVHPAYFSRYRKGVDGFVGVTPEVTEWAIKAGVDKRDVRHTGYPGREPFWDMIIQQEPHEDWLTDREAVFPWLRQALEKEGLELGRDDLQKLMRALDYTKIPLVITGWTDRQWPLVEAVLSRISQDDTLKGEVQVILLCGSDRDYYQQLQQRIASDRTGFLPETLFPLQRVNAEVMSRLLRYARKQLLLTSAGPNTILEAIDAWAEDLIVSRAIPGQERGSYVVKKKLGQFFEGNIQETETATIERLKKERNGTSCPYPDHLRLLRDEVVGLGPEGLKEALLYFGRRWSSVPVRSSLSSWISGIPS